VAAVAAVVLGAFVGLFGLAVLSKVDGWRRWSFAVAGFVGVEAAPYARAIVPLAEAAVLVLMVVDPRAGLLAAAVLLLLLGSVVLVLGRRHRGTSCNCFGAAFEAKIGPVLAARNILLSATAFALVADTSPSRLTTAELIVAMAAAVVVLLTSEARAFAKKTAAAARAEVAQ
jgi:hypothetical protein